MPTYLPLVPIPVTYVLYTEWCTCRQNYQRSSEWFIQDTTFLHIIPSWKICSVSSNSYVYPIFLFYLGLIFNGHHKHFLWFLYLTHVSEHNPYIYRVSKEEWTKLRESVPYVKLYRYNPKHLYPKLNGYGDNGHWKVWASGVSTYCKPSVTPYSSTAHARQRETTS